MRRIAHPTQRLQEDIRSVAREQREHGAARLLLRVLNTERIARREADMQLTESLREVVSNRRTPRRKAGPISAVPTTILAADGIALSADVYAPDSPQPAAGFPTIIFINSWALNKKEYAVQAMRMAKDGYLVVSYSARGWGMSGGQVSVAGPEDVSDIRCVVDWVIRDGRADPGRIGLAGISYGGGLSLLGLADDERIKTAVAMSGWADLRESFYGGKSPRSLWGKILVISGKLTGNLHPVIKKMQRKLLAHEDVPNTLAWAHERSPIKYLGQINERKAPVYISQNLSDPLFQPNSVVDLYTRLDGPKRLDLNQGSHATAEVSGLFGAENYVWSRAHQWLDHWLKDQQSSPLSGSPISVEPPDVEHRWSLEDWPDTDALRQSFYLHPRHAFERGALASEPPPAPRANRIARGMASGANIGAPVVGAVLDAHLELSRLTWIPILNRLTSCAYLTSPFTRTRRILGAPKLTLWIEPTRSEVQLVAHLYEVKHLGWGRFITHGPVTLTDARPGEVQKVEIELVTTVHQMESGAKLALVIDTYDPQYKVPTRLPYFVRLHYSEEHPSELTVPFLT